MNDKSYKANGFYFEFFMQKNIESFEIKTLNFYREHDKNKIQLKNFHYELYIKDNSDSSLKFGCWIEESQIPKNTITYLFDEEFELVSIELADIFDVIIEVDNIFFKESSFSFETHKFNSFLIDESNHCMQNLIANKFTCNSKNFDKIRFGYKVKYKSGESEEVYKRIKGLEINHSFANINFFRLNSDIISLTGFIKLENYNDWDYYDFLDIIDIDEEMSFEFFVSNYHKVTYKIERKPVKFLNHIRLNFVEFKRDKIGWTCNFLEEYE